jgi:hypothetical protein
MSNANDPKDRQTGSQTGSTRSGHPDEHLKREVGQFQEQLGIEKMEDKDAASNEGINATGETLNQEVVQNDKTGNDGKQVVNTQDQTDIINSDGAPDVSINSQD